MRYLKWHVRMTVVLANLLLFDAFCVTNTHENRMMHSHENCVTSAYEKHVTGWLEETEQVEDACCGCGALRRHSQRSSLAQRVGFAFPTQANQST